MENNDLKEKVRKKIKEKIAISVIKEELNQNNKVKRYPIMKKTISIVASLILIIIGTMGVYAACGGTINGKPIIEWLGIKFSDKYEEYKVDVQNQEISNNETSISLVGTVMEITEYIIIEKKENNSKVRVELKKKLDNKPFGNFEINLENRQ